MRKITMTREIMRSYFHGHRTSKWTPHRPYCNVCSCLDRRVTHYPDGRIKRRFHVSYITEGEECIEIRFAGGKVAYYHVKCIEKLGKDSSLLSLDIDKFKGIDTFIESLRAEQRTDPQIIQAIMEKYQTSHTTAWRKLKAHN